MNDNAENSNQRGKVGRNPVVFDSVKIQEVERLASVLTIVQMADFFGISEKTFIEIKKRQPEVSTAYKRGKAKAVGIAGGQLLSLIEQGNLQAITFYLSRRGGWTEKQEVDVNNTTTVTLPTVTEEFKELRQRAINKIDVG